MEEYAEELRTPPVTLVSLVGMPELHQTISAFLHSEQPPINTLALPDFGKISIIASKSKENFDSVKPTGILKREWLAKHRTRAPAVVAALFSSDQITGDPAQWLQICTYIDSLKAVVRGRNTKLVLVIVQPSIRDEIHDDLMTTLRKRAEIDSKYIITLVLNDPLEKKRSFQRLGAMFAELSIVYYREQGRKNKTRVEKKSFSFADLHVRYCFKAAVFAEFRRDWAEALRLYNDAYTALYEMIGMSSELPIQRLVELKTVAEHLHFKMSTLLLHGGKVAEAVKGFQKHIAGAEQLVGPAEADFLHGEWLSRQFLVFAELLETSSPAGAALTEFDFQPAYYYQMSAHNLRRKKESLERTLLELEGAEWRSKSESAAVESIVPSLFVGQFSRLQEDESNPLATILLSDAEYTAFALAEAKRFQDSFEIIALYKKSMDSYTALKATRMATFCANRMAKEYLSVGDFTNAKKTLNPILDLYRKESWSTLLSEALTFSRECSLKLGLIKDFIESSLELTTLPDEMGQSQTLSQRGKIQGEVTELLKSGSFDSIKVEQGVDLEVNAGSPLRTVFVASVAFHEQLVKPGNPAKLTLSLLSMLPQPVDLNQVEVQFNQSVSNITVGSVSLTPRRWLHLTHEVQSAQSGKLDCLSVIASIGQWCKIHLIAESPSSIDASSPLSPPPPSSSSPPPPPSSSSLNLDQVQNHPAETLILSTAGQKTIHVDDPDPDIHLTIPVSSGPALVGEIYQVPFSVTSATAILSGELKINLVDATAEAAAPEPHHVELLSINAQEGKQEDKIKEIRHSFGLVSVPSLSPGDSWSGDLHIQWHRPRVIIIFISLAYSDSVGQQVKIQRNLQIEGKTPLTTTHRFLSSFRSEPLLLSKLQPQTSPFLLPESQTTVLAVSALNCCHVSLRLLNLTVEDAGESLLHNPTADDLTNIIIAPGEEFRRFFTVYPHKTSSKMELGYACLKWSRLEGDCAVAVRQKLPEVAAEAPPLVVKIECPAYAVLAEPFTLNVRLQNESSLLQEIKYSVGDCQGFVFSGPHQDKISVLPRSVHVSSHEMIALSTGFQRLPQVNIWSTRYSAKVSASVSASTVFIFPSKQQTI